jgi:hypothetical protein
MPVVKVADGLAQGVDAGLLCGCGFRFCSVLSGVEQSVPARAEVVFGEEAGDALEEGGFADPQELAGWPSGR